MDHTAYNKGGSDKYKTGSALILTVLIVTVLISMALALSSIFTPKIRVAGTVKRSVPALYAADTGLEHCLYISRIGPAPTPTFNNGASYTITPPNCSAAPFRSVGSFEGSTRALEASL